MGPVRRHGRAALAAALALAACGRAAPPPVPPTPPGELPAPLRLLSHADPPAELLVFDHPRGRDFVAALALALDAVNRARGPEAPAIALLVLRWRHDRGEARIPALAETRVARVEVPTRFDVWTRDFVEIAAAGRGPGTQLVLLDPDRGRRERPAGGLARFVPELALRWRASWVRLPRSTARADGAGNVQALPDGTVLLGSTAGAGWADLLSARSAGGPPTRVDTAFLHVGHVDEILSHVIVGPGRCDFALVRAAPARALALVRAHRDTAPDAVRSRLGSVGAPTDGDRLQRALDARIATAAEGARAAVAARGCPPPPVVELPVLFACEGGAAAPRACRSLLPNPVNATVLGRHVLAPEPGWAPFEEAVRAALEARGQTLHLLPGERHHERRGGVHCATNVRRWPAGVPGRATPREIARP